MGKETSSEIVRPHSAKAWFLAARPKTLSGAAVPVMIGISMAYADCSDDNPFSWFPAILCFLFAFIMQIDANFINDYFDFLNGNDDETRLGPKRACAMGWIRPDAMRRAIYTTTAIACLTGLPLILYGGWEMVLVGILCVTFCFLYTTHLSYLGLGDILVLLFFGVIPVYIPYYLETHRMGLNVLLASVACGMVIDTLLVVNNYRDIENDRKNDKMTLIVRVGTKGGRLLYLFLGIAACILGAVHICDNRPLAFFLPLIYLVIHFFTYLHMVKVDHGRALNKILGETARNMFFYGLLVAIGILLS